MAGDACTSGLTGDRYVIGITVEGSDVVLDPLECRLDVPQTVVTGKISVVFIQHISEAELPHLTLIALCYPYDMHYVYFRLTDDSTFAMKRVIRTKRHPLIFRSSWAHR